MPRFGLVVEGSYDEAALTELIHKCAHSQVDVIGRPCGSKQALMKRFPGFLEEFRYGSDINKALVVRDANNEDPADLIKRMQSKVPDRVYPFPVKLLTIVRELEAWLLADEIAISAVTGKKPSMVQKPENLGNPKERLEKVLSEARIAYTAEVARKIAASVTIETLKARCPSFKQFCEAVFDC